MPIRFAAHGTRSHPPRHGRALVALVLLDAAVGAIAQAQVPLTLAAAQKLALERSPQVAAQRSLVDAARELAQPAGALPDPKLIAGIDNLPTEGADRWKFNRDPMTMTRIGLMQEIPGGDKRRLRVERANREVARGEVSTEVAALAVRRDVSTTWLVRHYAERQARAVGEQIDEARLQADAAAAQYRAGRGPLGDVLAAQALAVELGNRATDAALLVERARIALARHVGTAEADRPLAAAPDVLALPDAIARLLDVDDQPAIKLARAQESLRDAEVDLAAAAKSPDWSVELTYGIRPEFGGMVSLMVRVDLPWQPGARQDREHAAQLKERDAARAQREDLQRERESEVRQMLAEWEAMRAQAARVRDELVPLAERRVEAAMAAYRGGGAPLVPVLEARRAVLEARLAQLSYEQSAARAWAWLATLGLGEST
jgi:outer membrane protein TolC